MELKSNITPKQIVYQIEPLSFFSLSWKGTNKDRYHPHEIEAKCKNLLPLE